MPNSDPPTRSHGLVPSFRSSHQPSNVPIPTAPASCQLASMYGPAFRYALATLSPSPGRSLSPLPAISPFSEKAAPFSTRLDWPSNAACYAGRRAAPLQQRARQLAPRLARERARRARQGAGADGTRAQGGFPRALRRGLRAGAALDPPARLPGVELFRARPARPLADASAHLGQLGRAHLRRRDGGGPGRSRPRRAGGGAHCAGAASVRQGDAGSFLDRRAHPDPRRPRIVTANANFHREPARAPSWRRRRNTSRSLRLRGGFLL